MPEQSDWELIQEFNSERADHTFQTLVNRYLNLVYSAALRQVRDPQMAEDVSQAVFVILIKRSPQFSPKTVLAGWLFRTTRFVAAKAIRTEQRRRLRESLAIVMNEQPNDSEDSFWQEIEPFLDEAIAQLPEVERNAVLERFFNGKSFKLVAEGLGTTEEAARKRVNRALEKLRDFFAHKKVGISALMLVGLLNERVLVAAPSALKASIGKDFGASISSSVRKLVEDSINIPGAARPPVLVAGAACIFLILVIGIWQNKQHSDSPRINPNLSVGITQTGTVRAASSRKSSSEKPRNVLPLRVLSAINNDPLEARLRINYWLSRGAAAETVITNPKGEAALRLSGRDFEKLHVWVSAKGHVPKLVRWNESELRGLIEEYVIFLNPGRAVAGTVVDELGKPIPFVRIDPASGGMNMAERESVGFHSLLARVSSDLNGRWRFDQLPEGMPSFSFHFSHPDFARKTAEMAAQQTNHLTILGKGFQFFGLVSSTNGEPMDGVKVEERPGNGAPEDSTVSDDYGKFAFNHLNQGDTTLTLTAKGYQTLTRMIQLVSNAHSEQFIMLPDSNSEVSPSTSRFVQVTVTAVDALTDEPLKSFNVAQVRGITFSAFIGEGRAGKLQWRQRSWEKEKFVVEVQAEGYMPERTEPAVLDGENYSFQVKLRPDSGTRGIVLKPNGEPAIGAQVHLSGKNFHPIMALNGILQSESSDGSLRCIHKLTVGVAVGVPPVVEGGRLAARMGRTFSRRVE